MTNDTEKEAWDKFSGYETVMLATSEGGRPRVRPVTLIRYRDSFWVAAGAESTKIAQIRADPKVEFCLLLQSGAGNGYVRVAGSGEVVDNQKIKEELACHIEFFADYWKGADDSTYALIKISPREVEYLRPGEMLSHRFPIREGV